MQLKQNVQTTPVRPDTPAQPHTVRSLAWVGALKGHADVQQKRFIEALERL